MGPIAFVQHRFEKLCHIQVMLPCCAGHVEVGQEILVMLRAQKTCLEVLQDMQKQDRERIVWAEAGIMVLKMLKVKYAFSLHVYSENSPMLSLNDNTKCCDVATALRFKGANSKIQRNRRTNRNFEAFLCHLHTFIKRMKFCYRFWALVTRFVQGWRPYKMCYIH